VQATDVSLDGRIFRGASEKAEAGEASPATVFEYEDGGVIWAQRAMRAASWGLVSSSGPETVTSSSSATAS
jgi:hypothetical protein